MGSSVLGSELVVLQDRVRDAQVSFVFSFSVLCAPFAPLIHEC